MGVFFHNKKIKIILALAFCLLVVIILATA